MRIHADSEAVFGNGLVAGELIVDVADAARRPGVEARMEQRLAVIKRTLETGMQQGSDGIADIGCQGDS